MPESRGNLILYRHSAPALKPHKSLDRIRRAAPLFRARFPVPRQRFAAPFTAIHRSDGQGDAGAADVQFR
jgi:hypothetical protein